MNTIELEGNGKDPELAVHTDGRRAILVWPTDAGPGHQEEYENQLAMLLTCWNETAEEAERVLRKDRVLIRGACGC